MSYLDLLPLFPSELRTIDEFKSLIEKIHNPENAKYYPEYGRELARILYKSMPGQTMENFQAEWERLMG